MTKGIWLSCLNLRMARLNALPVAAICNNHSPSKSQRVLFLSNLDSGRRAQHHVRAIPEASRDTNHREV